MVNIRATGLKQFWTDIYPNSIYLWHGAKHDLPLPVIENDPVPTHEDILFKLSDIQAGHDFCKLMYYKTFPRLAERLNQIHGTNFSLRFWQICFGKWLYRHIAVIFEKYTYLQKLDINNTGIKLLNKDNFFIPKDHYEYILCFTNHFGVQQLVSLYYNIFSDKQFESVSMPFANKTIDFCNIYGEDECRPIDIALLGVYLTGDIYSQIHGQSQGRISNISPRYDGNISFPKDYEARSSISATPDYRTFEDYLYKSLYHCMPKEFIENFRYYIDLFGRDIELRKFKCIVAEAWISNIPSAIYSALAAEKQIKFISYEHGAGNVFFKNFLTFIEQDVSDVYLSVGWGKSEGRFVKGGFAVREILPYDYKIARDKILYISLTKSPYVIELNEATAPNATFLKELRTAYDFTENLPSRLKNHLYFRPRPKDAFFWDTESSLELERRNIQIERGDFRAALHEAKIIVIDHISTGISEILMMGAPFILLNDVTNYNFEDRVMPIFDKLMAAGVLHLNAESAINHVNKVYDDVLGWWFSEAVQEAVAEIRDYSLAPASRVTDYLLNLLKDETQRSSYLNEERLLQREMLPGQPTESSRQLSYGLGLLNENSDDPSNREGAFWILKAASQGDPEAENRMAWLYETGRGVDIDYDRALYWYSKAAEHGSVEACANIGAMYSRGQGVSKDYLTAYVWFRISGLNGDTNVKAIEKTLEEILSPDQIEYGKQVSHLWVEKHRTGNTVSR